MSTPGVISKTIVDLVLDFLIPLILPSAAGNRAAARDAALEMLSDYRPHTGEEFRLAGEIIGFSLQALGALRAASRPDTPNGAMMELLKTASALRRNESAAQRKLDALQRPRLAPPQKTEVRRQSAAAEPAAPHADTPHERGSMADQAPHSPANVGHPTAVHTTAARAMRSEPDLKAATASMTEEEKGLADLLTSFGGGTINRVLHAPAPQKT